MKITQSQRVSGLAFLLMVLFTSPALADMAKLKALYAKARTQYFQLELPEAEKTLQEAIKLASDSKLKGLQVARLYLLAGVVKFINSKDKAAATALMLAGLKLDRNAKIDADIVTPELTAVYDGAVKQLPVVVKRIPFKIFHDKPSRAKAGTVLPVVARVQGNPPYRVNLYYRNNELPIFTRVEMLPGKPGQFLLTVPKELLVGKRLMYYFEVVDDKEKVVANLGTEGSPLVVRIIGSIDTKDPTTPRKYKLVNLILGVGTGAGVATGDSDRDSTLKTNAGFAFSPLFVWVELGFFLHPAWELAAYYRFQVLSALAHAGGIKAKWYIGHKLPFRYYLSFGGGGGQIKHTVDFTQPNATEKFVDTTTEGVGHVGLGFGILYNFTPNVGILAELYNTGHFPQLSFQMDLYVALAINF